MKNLRMALFPLTILVAVVLRNNMVDAGPAPPGPVGGATSGLANGPGGPNPGVAAPTPDDADKVPGDMGGAVGGMLSNMGDALTPSAPDADPNANVDVKVDDNGAGGGGAAGGAGAEGAAGGVGGAGEEASGGRGFPPILRNLLRALQKVQKKYKRS